MPRLVSLPTVAAPDDPVPPERGNPQKFVVEVRESRIDGVPTVREFMDRRLAPAMNTCESVVSRQEALAARLARQHPTLRQLAFYKTHLNVRLPNFFGEAPAAAAPPN